MGTTQGSAPAVVVAVDGSGRGTGALRYAIDEARTRRTGVRMVHVLDDDGSPDREIMDSAMSQACAAAPDVEFDWSFRRGARADRLVEAATAGDLLVLGRAAPRSAGRPAVGTVTTEVAARTAASMAVVPSDWRARRQGRVVVAVKSCTNAGELLAHAFDAASARHAALPVVHVCDPDRRAVDGPALEALVRDWSAAFPDLEVETFVVHGEPGHALVDAAVDADVLMTARHHRDLRHLVRLGPVPRAVLGFSDTPVEIVPLTGASTIAPLTLERAGTILKN